MTLSVNKMSIGSISCNLADDQKRNCTFTPRGEVEMTPKSKGENCNEPHINLEEENHRKNRIFESYIRERVL
ncbi:hypothetical protein E2P64_06665 [Candidatus Bathyarchaeota archaeon]|nr:hypothetical protein E2P64_06665 [Candidatus Bathyarchaeota archaeon]